MTIFFFSVNIEFEKLQNDAEKTLDKYVAIAKHERELLTIDQIKDWVESRDNPSKFK